MRRLKTIGLACAFGIAAMSATSPASAADVTIKAVGTWGNLTNYQKHEGPFWSEVIGKASGGSIKGEIKPQTDLGLKGFEIMRLLKQGVFNYAHGVMGYVSAENAMFDGVDLSSLAQDITT
jgi:TRAP-type C4-dicarboxylate transport system substrate-binding protein